MSNKTSNASVTLKRISELQGLAPLYCHYRNQNQPQPAYVEIDEDGVVTADSSAEIGNSTPMSVWHGRTLRIACPSDVSGPALVEYLEAKVNGLLSTIYDGHSVRWDGNNYVGKLTPEAKEAVKQMERDLESLDLAEVCPASDWIENSNIADLWPEGKTLSPAASDLEDEADSDGIVIDGDMEDALRQKAQDYFDRHDEIPAHMAEAVEK